MTQLLTLSSARPGIAPDAQSRDPRRGAALVLVLVSLSLAGCMVAPHQHGQVVYSPAPAPAYPDGQAAGSPQGQVPYVVNSVQVPQSSLPPNGGFSVAEILTQAKGGRPVVELVADIRARGLNAPLKQADVDLLATNGVAREVVDAALSAPVNTVTTSNPQVVTRSYYYYPWVPFVFGAYWGAWRPYYYPYYSYVPRYYGVPHYHGGGGWYGSRGLPPSGWGFRGRSR